MDERILQTPLLGNTGGKEQNEGDGGSAKRGVNLHWLRATVFPPSSQGRDRPLSPLRVQGVIAEALRVSEADFQRMAGGRDGFAEVAYTETGLRHYRHHHGGNFTSVEFTGTGCEVWGSVNIREVLQALEAEGCGLRGTRLDTAADGVWLTPLEAYEAWGAGHVACRARHHDYRANGEGRTFYIGKPATGWQLCLYDRRGFNRAEWRWFAENAAALLAVMVRDGWAEAARLAGSLAKGRVQVAAKGGAARPVWVDGSDDGGPPLPVVAARASSHRASALGIVQSARERLARLLGDAFVLGMGLGLPPDVLAERLAAMEAGYREKPDAETAKAIARLRSAMDRLA